MSNAAAAAEAPPPTAGKKKLILIAAAAALVVLLAAGIGTWLLMRTSAEDEDDEQAEAPKKTARASEVKRNPGVPPTYLPLDLFVVNLADREGERYAQIGMTLELEDAKSADQLRTFMPAIRNNILMVLAHKTSAELLEREGKVRLADEVRRAAVRAIGMNVPEKPAEEEEANAKAKRKNKKKASEPKLPITAVHFSNFIVQ